MYGWLARGSWTDLGCPEEYRAATKWMLDKLSGTKITGHLQIEDAKLSGPLVIENGVTLGSNSAVIGPGVIGNNTVIGDNVLIGPYTTIGEECWIGNNSQIFSSCIYNGVHIGDNNTVYGAVIDNNTVVENNCVLENGTVIGPRVIVKDGAIIHSDVRVWPEVTIQSRDEIQKNVINESFETSITGS
jgi:mannose-1-phosphate guanylyltransferase